MRLAALAAALAVMACGGSRGNARKPLAADHQLHYRYVGMTDRHVCSAPASARSACTAQGADCTLTSPVQYWEGPMQCSGVRPEDEDADAREEEARIKALATPVCECSCDPTYRAELAEYNAKLDKCSHAP